MVVLAWSPLSPSSLVEELLISSVCVQDKGGAGDMASEEEAGNLARDCKAFYEKRLRLTSSVSSKWKPAPPASSSGLSPSSPDDHFSKLPSQIAQLRTELLSLAHLDNQLFKNLLALNDKLEELKLQRSTGQLELEASQFSHLSGDEASESATTEEYDDDDIDEEVLEQDPEEAEAFYSSLPPAQILEQASSQVPSGSSASSEAASSATNSASSHLGGLDVIGGLKFMLRSRSFLLRPPFHKKSNTLSRSTPRRSRGINQAESSSPFRYVPTLGKSYDAIIANCEISTFSHIKSFGFCCCWERTRRSLPSLAWSGVNILNHHHLQHCAPVLKISHAAAAGESLDVILLSFSFLFRTFDRIQENRVADDFVNRNASSAPGKGAAGQLLRSQSAERQQQKKKTSSNESSWLTAPSGSSATLTRGFHLPHTSSKSLWQRVFVGGNNTSANHSNHTNHGLASGPESLPCSWRIIDMDDKSPPPTLKHIKQNSFDSGIHHSDSSEYSIKVWYVFQFIISNLKKKTSQKAGK